MFKIDTELDYFKVKSLKSIAYYTLKLLLLLVIIVFCIYSIIDCHSYILLFSVISCLILLSPVFIDSVFNIIKKARDYLIILELSNYANKLDVQITEEKD